jgi:hypothetical protein
MGEKKNEYAVVAQNLNKTTLNTDVDESIRTDLKEI